MNKNKLSERDTKALLILGMVLMFALAYFVGFSLLMKSKLHVQSENLKLTTKRNELRLKEAQRETVLNDTEKLKGETKEIRDLFQDKVTTEGIIMDMIKLEEETNHSKITQIDLTMNQLFYPSSDSEVVDTAEEEVTIDANNIPGAEASTDVTEDSSSSETMSSGTTVYQSICKVKIEKLSYDGLKKLFEFSRQHNTRMQVLDAQVQFSYEDGLLNGDFEFAFYALEGSENKYSVPNIKGVDLGRKNIFGTFEKSK